MTTHDLMVAETGLCPWCGSALMERMLDEAECPEPPGRDEVTQ